ncbi:MAG TPA: outer membrane beta-barrel protein [Candidatus Binatia bacterium]|nr:outer membrane beta-barrel protein [Candidatus Binatia bacterium]
MSRNVVGGLMALLVIALPLAARADDLTGFGGIGFRGGLSKFGSEANTPLSLTTNQPLADGTKPRLSGDLVFSYVFGSHVWGDVTVGYAWNRLDTNDNRFWLESAVPITGGLRYLLHEGKAIRPYVGAGGGFYVWSIQSKDLGAAKDPSTFERYRRADPGVYGMAGVERTMSKHISTTADVVYHHIFAQNTADFPSGYNGNKSFTQIRLGVSFYFTLTERIDTGLPE